VSAEVALCLAEEREKAGREKNLTKVDDVLARLEAEMRRVREELSQTGQFILVWLTKSNCAN
jgi:hypothetical protein